MVSDYKVLPDGQYVAFRQNYQVFVTPLMPGTQDVAADAKGSALPVTQVSAVGAEFIHWSGGGRRLHWSTGPTVYTVDAAALFGAGPQAENAAKFKPPASVLTITSPAACLGSGTSRISRAWGPENCGMTRALMRLSVSISCVPVPEQVEAWRASAHALRRSIAGQNGRG